MEVLIKPILTEKMNAQSEKFNRYGFIVDARASKDQIRSKVEEIYGVAVKEVNTMNYNGKLKSRYTTAGMLEGRTDRYKKAVVTLKAEDKIDFYASI